METRRAPTPRLMVSSALPVATSQRVTLPLEQADARTLPWLPKAIPRMSLSLGPRNAWTTLPVATSHTLTSSSELAARSLLSCEKATAWTTLGTFSNVCTGLKVAMFQTVTWYFREPVPQARSLPSGLNDVAHG